jgi:predicted nucleotidyltransferase component of viral defense system
MQDLIEQERFEMEVPDRLNSGKFLRSLVFEGGTMLRLCHGLDRFSVDLDFYMKNPGESRVLFSALSSYLSESYALRDAADKHFTILFELRAPHYPRSLKIEIRKEAKSFKTEQAIAFSPHSTRQVLLNVVSLQDMMNSKLKSFLSRREIRDVYDMEFLYKMGIKIVGDRKALETLLRRINSLAPKEYSVKLGSLLTPDKRAYYIAQNFRILKAAVSEQVSDST